MTKTGLAIIIAVIILLLAPFIIAARNKFTRGDKFAAVLVPQDCWDECTTWCNSIGDGPICYHDCKSKCQWP